MQPTRHKPWLEAIHWEAPEGHKTGAQYDIELLVPMAEAAIPIQLPSWFGCWIAEAGSRT